MSLSMPAVESQKFNPGIVAASPDAEYKEYAAAMGEPYRM